MINRVFLIYCTNLFGNKKDNDTLVKSIADCEPKRVWLIN